MDPVSAIGLAAGIAQLIDSVAHTISYIKDVKNTSKERAQILQEAASLLGLLTTLKYKVEYADTTDAWFFHVRSLGGPGGPLEQFESGLEELAKNLKLELGIKSLGKRLFWTLDKSQVKNMLNMIERLKTLIGIALQEDNFQLSLAIKDNVASLDRRLNDISDNIAELGNHQEIRVQRVLDNERQAVVHWLCPLNFAPKQLDILSRREEGTGQWLLEKEDFKAWRDGSTQTIWCPGIPGAGKTVLAAIVANHLGQTFSSDEKVAVAFIYLSYQEQEDQTTANLVATILQQLIQRKGEVSKDIMTLCKNHTALRTRPTVDELSRLLLIEIRGFSKVFLLVDAVDECAESNGVRDGFLALLRTLVEQPNVRLMLTSRPMAGIRAGFPSLLEIPIRASDRDLRQFLEARIPDKRRLAPHVRADPGLQETIIAVLIDKAAGMFLLASLQLDALAVKHNKREILKALDALPARLSDTYKEAMERICCQNSEDVQLAKRIISWVSYALRPLSVKELQFAVAIEPGMVALDEDALPHEDLLVDLCTGLIIIDHESGIIRLVHYTAQEYIYDHRVVLRPVSEADIVVACLTFFLFDTFTTAVCKSSLSPWTWDCKCSLCSEQQRFAYARVNWAAHLRGALEKDHVIAPLILKLLYNDFAVRNLLKGYPYSAYIFRYYSRSYVGLHVAAFLGFSVVIETLLHLGASTEEIDGQGFTALHWAAIGGHDAAIELLLGYGAQIDKRALDGSTALHIAALEGHKSSISLLCGLGATVDLKFRRRNTAF